MSIYYLKLLLKHYSFLEIYVEYNYVVVPCRYIFLYALLTTWIHQWGDNFEENHNSLFNELSAETQAEAEIEPMKRSSYWLLLAFLHSLWPLVLGIISAVFFRPFYISQQSR